MTNLKDNVELPEHFRQVCVWPGTVLKQEEIPEFVQWMQSEFSTRAHFLESITTAPDTENGKPVPDTGGREDVFFVIHDEDIGKFAVPRLSIGMRWIEDVLARCNYHSRIYPERVFSYCSWNTESLASDPTATPESYESEDANE